jgi:hypothetical protein
VQNVRRKIKDIAVSLGISRSTLNVIQRRLSMDKYLVYIGMLAILLLILILRYYL